MPVIYTELYTNECEKPFKLDRKEVQQSMAYPDQHQKLVSQGLQIWIYLKKFEKYYLLTYGHIEGSNYLVELVFKLKEDLVNRAQNQLPQHVLHALALQFGLELQIGQQKGKFIYNELIPVTSTNPAKIVHVVNPNNHSFITSFFIRPLQQHDQNYAQVAIAFALDKDEYKQWLTS